jgi:hypothetical protein
MIGKLLLSVKQMVSRLSTRQHHYINKPLRAEYEAWCKARSVKPNIVKLKSGIEGLWVGDPERAENVVVYCEFSELRDDYRANEHFRSWSVPEFVRQMHIL